MDFSILNLEIESGIGLLTISRPKALNALNSLFFIELDQIISAVEKRNDIKVLIITGEGKAFVAGADIVEMQGMTKKESFEFSQMGQKTFEKLENLSIPVIGAVNGFALGGGLELALACDFRIANTYAKFGFPEVSLGLIPGYAGTQRLSRLIGQGNALYLQMTASMIPADEALRLGIVQKVCEPEELLPQANKLAGKIIACGPNAVKKVKRVVLDGLNKNFSDGCMLESNEFSNLFESDGIEGMKAFIEKRKPNW
ncbi:enoyl-CoA hydratase/isomerase family protein [Bacteroidota bacterium]